MNRVMLFGKIANDVELRKTQTGKSWLSFTVVTSETYNGKTTTDYVDCRAWEGVAEYIASHCHKDSAVFVEGKNKSESYEKDGVKQRAKYVLASNVEALGETDTRNTVATDTPKVTMKTTPKWEYESLGDGDRDVTGHLIAPEELPFY